MKNIRVLVGCECSGTVRDAFLALGADAYSCDVKPCEKGSNRHYQCDIFEVLNKGWDLLIAHPPCTYLSYAGSRVWRQEGRAQLRAEAMQFFMALYNAPVPHICIENPRGEPIQHVRQTQKIQPYYFGDEAQKQTLLWLKNLPLLWHNAKPNLFGEPVTHVDRGEMFVDKRGEVRPVWFNKAYALPKEERQRVRSKTFAGVADAMASQWFNYLQNL
jgi:hypothetical protein